MKIGLLGTGFGIAHAGFESQLDHRHSPGRLRRDQIDGFDDTARSQVNKRTMCIDGT